MAVNSSVKESETGGLEAAQLRKMADFASEEMDAAQAASRTARNYYDHIQLTSAELAVLKKRKQPPLVINRIQRKVDAMVGIEQKGRVDPRALPRNPQDEDAADVATKALVYADDITRFDVHRSAFCYNLAIEGYGGVEVNVKDRNGQKDPDIIRLRWEEIFFDPYSRELDFSDATYMGVMKWMSLAKAKDFCRGYTEDMSDEVLEDILQQSLNTTSETYEDRPSAVGKAGWGDKKTQRVKLAYMYYQHEGTWRLCLFTGGGVIYDEVSPFLDFTDDPEGVPSNAIALQACYIDQENKRYGIVTGMIPMQDEINARRSKLLHQLNSRQTMGQKGAVSDAKIMKRELAAPDGHVEYDQDPSTNVPSFQIVPQTDQIAGQFQLLQESKGEIDMLGPNASLLGQLEGDHSGRAIIAQQQAGMAELAPFYDNLRDWTLRVYRMMWNRIRQFWKEPRWVRVTDESEKLQFVGINQPMQQPAMDPMTGQPMPGPDGQPMMQPMMGPNGQPQVENAIAEMDVDIIIDMTPEYASLQQEEFQSIVELLKSGAVQFPPEVIIEASSLRNKAKILEKMRGEQSPEQQQAAQEQAAAEKAAMMAQIGELQGKVEKLAADTEKARADTDLKRAQAAQIEQEMQFKPAEMAMEAEQADRSHGLETERFRHDATTAERQHGLEGAKLQQAAQSERGKMALEGARMAQDGQSAMSQDELARAQFAEQRRAAMAQESMGQQSHADDVRLKQQALKAKPAPK